MGRWEGCGRSLASSTSLILCMSHTFLHSSLSSLLTLWSGVSSSSQEEDLLLRECGSLRSSPFTQSYLTANIYLHVPTLQTG